MTETFVARLNRTTLERFAARLWNVLWLNWTEQPLSANNRHHDSPLRNTAPYNFRMVNNIYTIRPLLHCLFNMVLQVQDGLLFLVTKIALKLRAHAYKLPEVYCPHINHAIVWVPQHIIKKHPQSHIRYAWASSSSVPLWIQGFPCIHSYRKDTALVKIKHILLLEFHTGVAPRSTQATTKGT